MNDNELFEMIWNNQFMYEVRGQLGKDRYIQAVDILLLIEEHTKFRTYISKDLMDTLYGFAQLLLRNVVDAYAYEINDYLRIQAMWIEIDSILRNILNSQVDKTDNKDIIEELSNNNYIQKLIQDGSFNNKDFQDFINILLRLQDINKEYIEKEIGLLLYSYVKIIRIAFISTTEIEKKEQLEDMWVEVDAVLIDILSYKR